MTQRTPSILQNCQHTARSRNNNIPIEKQTRRPGPLPARTAGPSRARTVAENTHCLPSNATSSVCPLSGYT